MGLIKSKTVNEVFLTCSVFYEFNHPRASPWVLEYDNHKALKGGNIEI